MTWFNLSGDSRLGQCATEACGGAPTFRLEAGGVGSNYCSGCKVKIQSLHARGAGTLSRDNLTTKGEAT